MAASIDRQRVALARADRRARRGKLEEAETAVGAVVVTVSDETLLETLADLRWRLSLWLESGPPVLVVDLSAVRKLSSATIAVLLWVKKRCRARGVQLVVRGPSRGSSDVLRRTGLLPGRETQHPALRPVATRRVDHGAGS